MATFQATTTVTGLPTPLTGKMFGRICCQCGTIFFRNVKYSNLQWREKKYCSNVCAWKAKEVHDEFKNRMERWHRKRGQLKQGSPESIKMISEKTKAAMYRIDVQEKIRQPKGPQSFKKRKQTSDALAGRMPKNLSYSITSGPYSNVQRGYFDINGKRLFFRSKWEANYALYLDWLIKQKQIKLWEYEPDVFMFEKIKLGTRSYKPDFKVTTNRNLVEYHEIKGHFTQRSKTQFKRMAKYYPQTKVIVIDSKSYYDIKKKVGRMLSFY